MLKLVQVQELGESLLLAVQAQRDSRLIPSLISEWLRSGLFGFQIVGSFLEILLLLSNLIPLCSKIRLSVIRILLNLLRLFYDSEYGLFC